MSAAPDRSPNACANLATHGCTADRRANQSPNKRSDVCRHYRPNLTPSADDSRHTANSDNRSLKPIVSAGAYNGRGAAEQRIITWRQRNAGTVLQVGRRKSAIPATPNDRYDPP